MVCCFVVPNQITVEHSRESAWEKKYNQQLWLMSASRGLGEEEQGMSKQRAREHIYLRPQLLQQPLVISLFADS